MLHFSFVSSNSSDVIFVGRSRNATLFLNTTVPIVSSSPGLILISLSPRLMSFVSSDRGFLSLSCRPDTHSYAVDAHSFLLQSSASAFTPFFPSLPFSSILASDIIDPCATFESNNLRFNLLTEWIDESGDFRILIAKPDIRYTSGTFPILKGTAPDPPADYETLVQYSATSGLLNVSSFSKPISGKQVVLPGTDGGFILAYIVYFDSSYQCGGIGILCTAAIYPIAAPASFANQGVLQFGIEQKYAYEILFDPVTQTSYSPTFPVLNRFGADRIFFESYLVLSPDGSTVDAYAAPDGRKLREESTSQAEDLES